MLTKKLVLPATFLFLNLLLLNAQIKPMGLEPLNVRSISLSQSTAYPSQILVASTVDSGVYYYYLGMDCGWQNIGLAEYDIQDIFVQVNGAGPMDFYKIYAGMRAGKTDSSLIYTYSLDQDSTWNQNDSGLSPTSYSWVADMDGQDYSGHEQPTPVYAAVDGLLFRLSGQWEQIPFEGPFTEFVRVINDSTVWAGGSGMTMSPVLFKSTDGGLQWQMMDDSLCTFGCDNSCLSLATVTDRPDTVYLGMGEHVLKSEDGGAHWQETGLKDIQAGFNGIAVNPLDTEHIITYSRAETSVVYESFNGGDTWKMVPNPVPSFKIYKMSSGIYCQEFVTFFAPSTGVYSYIDTPDGIMSNKIPCAPAIASLQQNYPNPFNSSTMLSYRLLGPAHVQLTVFDALGKKVLNLVDEKQEAGVHPFHLDVASLSSGIYYYRLSVDHCYIQTKKMLLLR